MLRVLRCWGPKGAGADGAKVHVRAKDAGAPAVTVLKG